MRWLLAPAVAAGLSCSKAGDPTAVPNIDPVAAAPTATAPAEASLSAGIDPQLAGPHPPLPEDQQAILAEINGRYAEDSDPATWSARFEKAGREVHDEQDAILEALALTPGTAIADVGAGTGLYTMRFADVTGPEGKVYAVDIQTYFLEHLRKRAQRAGHDNVEVVQATASSVGLPAASVDLVFLCDAYHHIAQPLAYLASVRAALRPGGQLVVIDYHRGPVGTWRHGHIRATAEQFRSEIEGAGFTFDRRHDILDDNFFYVFRRT